MKTLFFYILLLSIGVSFSQTKNKVSLQFLGSSYSYYTLSYERSIIDFENSNLLLGSGFSFRKTPGNSHVYLTRELKELPLFFNNSFYLKYTLLNKRKLKPHISTGYLYSKLINKNDVGDSWQGVSRLKEYVPISPSLFINLGSSLYLKERLGVNLDVFLYKELRDFERFTSHYLVFFGIGVVYDL